MKRGLLIGLIMLLVVAPSTFGALVPIQEPIIGFIHPTAYTLRAGEWIIGDGLLLYGITDWMMIGTDPYLNLFILNLFGRVSLGYIPGLGADLAVNWAIVRTGPLLAVLRFSPVTAFGVGGTASMRVTDELTLHAGFGVGIGIAGLVGAGIPPLIIPSPVSLWMDYKLSPEIRLLGSFDTCLALEEIRIGAGIMTRWQWLWDATLLLGGIGRFDFDPGIFEEPISFHLAGELFWRF